jgi:cyanate lyase
MRDAGARQALEMVTSFPGGVFDFSKRIAKEDNPAGDRLAITVNGKFLPHKSW